MAEHQVPVVIEFILEGVTNVSMGTEIVAIIEFEKILDVATGAVDAEARVLEPV
jgi:tartronate-semialdehyde synthase